MRTGLQRAHLSQPLQLFIDICHSLQLAISNRCLHKSGQKLQLYLVGLSAATRNFGRGLIKQKHRTMPIIYQLFELL